MRLGHSIASTAVLLASASASPLATIPERAVTCAGSTFKSTTAQKFIDSINPGWNLGNTLDATPTEGDWGNPPVVPATFDDIKASGFKGVRLPVTWAYHFVDGTDNTGTSPSWKLQDSWLQRVSDVVDMTISRGLYTIVNVHHDSWIWADVTAANANYTMIEEKFYAIWYQVGTKLACKSELLGFEPINEPPGTTQQHADEINKLNTLFLKAINDAGGYNKQRVVTLVGLGEDSVKTSQFFKAPPANTTNPWAIQYHYYSPYDFIFSAWGKTIWGSDADKAAIETDLSAIRGNFTNVPLVIGEYSASTTNTEPAARWKYTDFLVRTAKKYSTSTILWDNGGDFLDRAANAWRDPTVPQLITNATVGTVNSLADSTTDISATTQSTSAYIFHKVGDAVQDMTLPYLFNGNTLKSIRLVGGKVLDPSRDYMVSGNNITFRYDFLSKSLFNSTTASGVRGTLVLTFSKGAELWVQAVTWAQPKLASTSSKAVAGADLHVPITWAGVAKPAAVKALESDGTYLVDDWTQYLPTLQQARTTYSSQWNWDSSSVIITSAAVQAVISAGKATTFTFEFYPRVPGNAVNYTLTV